MVNRIDRCAHICIVGFSQSEPLAAEISAHNADARSVRQVVRRYARKSLAQTPMCEAVAAAAHQTNDFDLGLLEKGAKQMRAEKSGGACQQYLAAGSRRVRAARLDIGRQKAVSGYWIR
jgi:hypothetical protein